jgi:hypothetical protein
VVSSVVVSVSKTLAKRRGHDFGGLRSGGGTLVRQCTHPGAGGEKQAPRLLELHAVPDAP